MNRGGRAPRSFSNRRARQTPAARQTPTDSAPVETLPPLRVGFVRGVAPSKWAERWLQVAPEQTLELIPLAHDQVDSARQELDVLLERTAPDAIPEGSEPLSRSRHAIRLYEEAVALVVPPDHELAGEKAIGLDELRLVTLLAHPDHHEGWPEAEPWGDPSWAPRNAVATLELVATGVGAALLSQPLASHLANKHDHRVVPVSDRSEPLPGTQIWASWSIERDNADVQRFAGLLRGRTPRSSR